MNHAAPTMSPVYDTVDETRTVARNVSTRYLAIGIEAILGLVILPFNVTHLGASAYGLWMLTASVTAYFSVLDLGYGGALVKFVAQYRARRDFAALNEILSTTFVIFGLVGLLTYLVYRANAYRVFPGLRLRLRSFRRARLREVTTFSVYILAIDWANKVNYSIDALVIGAFLSTSAVAVWTIGQRLAEVTQRLTNQLNEVLLPAVVDSDSAARTDRLQAIFIQGTRLSLASVVPMGGTMMLMAGPLVRAWVGPEFGASVLVLQLLSLSVIARVGGATAGTVLKGAGEHRVVAFTNVAAAVANLVLSVAFVKVFGLYGVALGTLLPIGLASTLVLFPAGCRRVQVPLPRAIAEGVWPAVWPAAVMTAFLLATRGLLPVTLVAVGLEMAAACVVYAMVFVGLGISAAERRVYLSKIRDLVRRRPFAERIVEGV